MQEERKIGGEECAVAALTDDDLASAQGTKAIEESRVRIAYEMMARQLTPLVVIEAGIMLFDRVDHDPFGGARRDNRRRS